MRRPRWLWATLCSSKQGLYLKAEIYVLTPRAMLLSETGEKLSYCNCYPGSLVSLFCCGTWRIQRVRLKLTKSYITDNSLGWQDGLVRKFFASPSRLCRIFLYILNTNLRMDEVHVRTLWQLLEVLQPLNNSRPIHECLDDGISRSASDISKP